MGIGLADGSMMKVIQPNKVAIYIRWSTDEQGEGNTLSVQLESCKKFIESQGWEVNERLIYIDDGWSGSNLDRPEMEKLRKDVKDDLIDCVIIWKIDRLSRSMVDTVDLVLKEWKYTTYVKSVNESFDTSTMMGMMMVSFLAIFAEIERENIRFRTFNGKVKNVEDKGLSAGFKAPYGYKVGKVTGTFEIIVEEAKIVKRIFRMYADGMGRSGIARQLNAEGILFRKGKKWNESTVAHIINNYLYTGRLVWGKLQRNNKRNVIDGEKFWNRRENPIIKELSKDVITPIISKDEFEKVRQIRESRDVFKDRRIAPRSFTSPHLLSGIIKCKCGHGMTSRRHQGTDAYAYYMCRGNKTKGDSFCDCGYLRQDIIDQIVVDSVKEKFLKGKDNIFQIAITQHNSRVEELTHSLNSINKQLADLENELSSIKHDYRKKIIKAEDYNMFKNDIVIETADLTEKKTLIQESLDSLESEAVDTADLDDFVESLGNWERLTIEQQKQLLLKWIGSVIVYKKKGKENKKLSVIIRYATNVEEQVSEHLLTS